MCFYTRTDYACGDWKWGNMKEQCPREHRTGMTCPAKLSHIDSNIESPQLCKLCTEITAKQRRLHKARLDLTRYTTYHPLPALAAAKKSEIHDIEQAIARLNEQRPSWRHLLSRAVCKGDDTSQVFRPVPSISGTFFPLAENYDGKYAEPTNNYNNSGGYNEAYRFPLSI